MSTSSPEPPCPSWSKPCRWSSWSRSATSPTSTGPSSCFEWTLWELLDEYYKSLHLKRWNTYDPNIFLTKTLNILSLPLYGMCPSSPTNGARCEPGLAEHDGSLLHFFTKNQTSSEIISLAFWTKGAYDDVWPSPRDTLHVSTSPKKVSFCALPKESLDNCPWLSVTLWWATWRNTL